MPPPVTDAAAVDPQVGQWRTDLDHGLQVLGLALPPTARQALLDYLALMLKWNRVYNLTAIRDPRQMLTQHLLDSLAIVPPLQQRLADRRPPLLVVDVGSGAGLPGVPLAVAWPQTHVTMVEPVGKKTAFIQHAIGALGLTHAACAQCRVEQLRQWPGTRLYGLDRRPPDLIISRAFASLADFARSVDAIAGPQTCVAAMKGALPLEEINDLPPGWQVDESIPVSVPGLNAQRHLILFRRST